VARRGLTGFVRAIAVASAVAVVAAAELHVQPLARDGRVLVSFELAGGVDRDVEEAIHSGLLTTFTYEVELRRGVTLWLDRTVQEATVSVTVQYDNLTRQHQVQVLVDGRVQDARVTTDEDAVRRALTVFETELGPDAREICDVLLNLGDCLAATGDYHGAKRYLWRGMVMSSYIFGSNHPATGDAVLTFGEFLLDHDDARDASPLLHRALAIYEEDEGANGPGVAKCLRALAVLHARLNEPDLAFLRYRRALAIWESDPDSADLLPELYRTYADLADAAGRPDDAAAARKRATK